MVIHINISKDEIAAFCRRNHIRSLAFFGSVLRADFGPDSDVDVEEELTELFGQKADLVERRAVEKSENYIRRRHVLKSVETVYVA